MTLDYYTLGKTGLRVSRLSLGTMTFGDDWGWGANEDASRDIFNAYVDAGGNFIDTADLYVKGKSEEMLGRFVAERKLRDQIVIATKFSFSGQANNPNAGGNGRKNILRAVEASLKRLGTDYIDLYFLHAWDGLTPPEEVMRTLDDLVRAGKIRHVGLSNTPGWYAGRAQTIAEFRGYEPVSALQLEYSLVQRNIEREFIDFGRETGAGIMVWSPLSGGLLSGKYRAGANGIEGEGRLHTLASSPNPAARKLGERQFEIVAELERVSKQIDKPMAQIALNWSATRPGVASVIIGVTKMSQLESNLAALNFTIPADALARLNAISEPETQYPYGFFRPELQAMLNGGATVGAKPPTYHTPR